MAEIGIEQKPLARLSLLELAAASFGGALLAVSQRRRGARHAAARALGAGLLAAAVVPLLGRRMLAAGERRRRVHLRTELRVDRSVREVFAFCHDFENFPRIIQSLSRVLDYQDGRSRWEVIAPSGELLTWDCVVTKYVPNAVIAWETVPDSVVDFCGVLRFAPLGAECTRLQVEIQYDPRHTGFGEALRALIDVPRERQIRADIARANFHLRALPPAVNDEPASNTEQATSPLD